MENLFIKSVIVKRKITIDQLPYYLIYQKILKDVVYKQIAQFF